MKYFVCVILFLLYACGGVNLPNDTKKNNKNKNIQMKVKTDQSIKVKKWKYFQP